MAVLANAVIMGIVGAIKSHYGFMYMFIMMIGNIILPVLGGVVIFHLLLGYLSKHFANLDKLPGKLLLSLVSVILFAVLFIGVDVALFGLSENTMLEYRGWLPSALITSIIVPVVYQMYSPRRERTG